MNESQIELPDDSQRCIDAYLDATDRALTRAGVSRSERRAITDELETHIREELASRSIESPTRAEVEAVIAGMDTPESYGPESTPGAGTGVGLDGQAGAGAVDRTVVEPGTPSVMPGSVRPPGRRSWLSVLAASWFAALLGMSLVGALIALIAAPFWPIGSFLGAIAGALVLCAAGTAMLALVRIASSGGHLRGYGLALVGLLGWLLVAPLPALMVPGAPFTGVLGNPMALAVAHHRQMAHGFSVLGPVAALLVLVVGAIAAHRAWRADSR
ncbi:MAG: hypothetical protein PVF43_14080 [Candidatus Eiseniibacteriota bacterium]|jgi:hypothetical protein